MSKPKRVILSHQNGVYSVSVRDESNALVVNSKGVPQVWSSGFRLNMERLLYKVAQDRELPAVDET